MPHTCTAKRKHPDTSSSMTCLSQGDPFPLRNTWRSGGGFLSISLKNTTWGQGGRGVKRARGGWRACGEHAVLRGQTVRAVLTGPQPQCIGTSRQVRTDRVTDRALLLFRSTGSYKQPSCPPPPTTHRRTPTTTTLVQYALFSSAKA